ncbi:hypothetical protein RIF29_28717 [Crotalaria pallida]|uniref:Uncharacterized protein n=1 Tax=Crotalaria pallida TaxID=3830 RepID=A0AAN9HWS5_CROPI
MADPVICRIDSSNSGVASLEDFGNCEQTGWTWEGFTDIPDEGIQEKFQEYVLEEEQNMKTWNKKLDEDAAIWELDDLQKDFEIWEPEEEEVQEEGQVEAPADESSFMFVISFR